MNPIRYEVGQRVRILPNRNFPPTRAPGGIRYGIIRGATEHEGMHIMDEDRTSRQGERVYIVASYHSPGAGAIWFSAKGLQPMKKDRTK